MELDERHDRIFILLTMITLIFAILPFVIYFISRIFGFLPSRAEYWSQPVNHGPWRWTIQGVLIWFPFPFLMVPITGIWGIYATVRNLRIKYLLFALVLLLVQGMFYFINFFTLFWTID